MSPGRSGRLLLWLLTDLRERLARTRWPDPETVDDWSQGIPLAYVQDVCAYWAEKYDWRAREARLNRFAQFRTEVGGLGIHFVHVRSPHADALPLVITHGWPGSIVEFQKVIEPLTNPTAHGGEARDAFHVVCPSLPGYGFSDKPASAGWNVERTGAAWAALMARLGYSRYVAEGGDWGSMVTRAVGVQDPSLDEGRRGQSDLQIVTVCRAPHRMPDVTGCRGPEPCLAAQGAQLLREDVIEEELAVRSCARHGDVASTELELAIGVRPLMPSDDAGVGQRAAVHGIDYPSAYRLSRQEDEVLL